MKLKLLNATFAVCKLPDALAFPDWALQAAPVFLAKTSDELSIICPESDVPANIDYSAGWRCFRVDGDLEFDQVGVVATVSAPIANAGLSLFLVSTHDRDYVLVHKDDLQKAITTYEAAGFAVNREDSE